MGMDVDNNKKRPVELTAAPTESDKGKQLFEATLARYQAVHQHEAWNAQDKARKVVGAVAVEQEDDILMEGRQEVWSGNDTDSEL
eukprot:scaffold3912_cov136-Amphora_coffeaeformis.AAC.3